MTTPKAFLFDVFGTVVDWRSGVATETERMFLKKGIKHDALGFADAWRGKYDPAMERIRSGGRGYVALDILHRENLDELLDETGLAPALDEPERAELNKAWEKLPPWPDSVSGLAHLKEKAIIATCSNGSIALMTRLAKFGKLPWDCILGAEIAKNYKPHREAFLKSVSALGVEPHDVVMVAAHNSDLYAARKYGLKTAFVPRPTEHGPGQSIDLKASENWDYIAETIEDIASII
ncbi:MAG: haloacid dehalogenase type II [Pseudomonadota bacterium]